jgi:chitodextrinase
MESYPDWNPDEVYVKGDRALHEGRLYVAAESVHGVEPDPGTGLEHWPWVLLGPQSPAQGTDRSGPAPGPAAMP